MKARSSKTAPRAFTLLEALVVIAFIAIMLAMLSPPRSGPARATLVYCLNNQRQLAVGEMIFTGDHAGKYPWQTETTNGGTMEITGQLDAAGHFLTLSNYIQNPKVFICPSDRSRQPAANQTTLSNSNVSYFLNLSAATNYPQRILSGDRHLQLDGKPVTTGPLLISSNATVAWTSELHSKSKGPVGNLGFSDGHAEIVKEKLDSYFKRENSVTNQLVIP